MNPLKIVKEVVRRGTGPTPAFNAIHVVEALELLGSEGPIGRIKLAQKLGLGEASARTILKHLKNLGLVEGSKRGYTLTGRGEKAYRRFKASVSGPFEVEPSSLAFGRYNLAFVVKNASGAVRMGLEQRDAAVKAGSQGALTLIFREDRLLIPGAEECCFEELSTLQRNLAGKLKLEDRDVVVVGVGRSRREAELGGKAAVLETLQRLWGGKLERG